MKITLLLILGLAVTNAYSVQMYQCEDETGNIQYTQTPSPNCVEVKPKPVQTISVPPSSKKAQDNSPADLNDNSKAPTPPKSQTIEEGCKIVADTLQKIAGKLALSKPDKNDPKKMVVLTKEEIEQERIKAQQYFDALCKEKKSTAENQPQQKPNETSTENQPQQQQNKTPAESEPKSESK
ncbi:hypothetical protein THII_1433 [Thioploca ingrica]|uniref:DUF4124 domain-containing protein n=1 Tax=Thioploca ingrica TaxID=40754 RepID=A0A090AKX7_9GAMM|nr:hypothetical protein THII_1433 [Thioploca ingrica]